MPYVGRGAARFPEYRPARNDTSAMLKIAIHTHVTLVFIALMSGYQPQSPFPDDLQGKRIRRRVLDAKENIGNPLEALLVKDGAGWKIAG